MSRSGESRFGEAAGRYDRAMRSHVAIIALLFVIGSFTIPYTAHAAIPFFGPIIPPQQVSGILGSETCAAGWGMLIMVANNIIAFSITIAIVFVAPIMIAYAGFLFVLNPVNAGGREHAKSVLWNTIAGIVIALAGWMIVDAIMAVLYNPGAVGGTWSSLITSGNIQETGCIPLKGSLSQSVEQNTAGINAGTLNSVLPGAPAGSACDPAAVQAAAAAGGYSLSNVEANTFACIARPESSCGKNLINYKWGSGSSAVGAFQVLLQRNGSCYDNKACTAAAGLPDGTSLNCAAGFKGGNPIPGSSIPQRCIDAAANLNCSASAAACLLKATGNFSPWQADVNNAVQTGCINNGG